MAFGQKDLLPLECGLGPEGWGREVAWCPRKVVGYSEAFQKVSNSLGTWQRWAAVHKAAQAGGRTTALHWLLQGAEDLRCRLLAAGLRLAPQSLLPAYVTLPHPRRHWKATFLCIGTRCGPGTSGIRRPTLKSEPTSYHEPW